MRRSNWILCSSVLLVILVLQPSCSREGSTSSPTAQAAGGSADPAGGTIDGATVPSAPGAPMKYQQPAVTKISELFNTNNPGAFWTRAVNLSGVTVQQVFSDKHFILVGPDKEHTLMVQMGELHPELKVGQKVDLAGVINPTGQDKTQWNVMPDEQKALAQHSLFVLEKSIKPASQ